MRILGFAIRVFLPAIAFSAAVCALFFAPQRRGRKRARLDVRLKGYGSPYTNEFDYSFSDITKIMGQGGIEIKGIEFM